MILLVVAGAGRAAAQLDRTHTPEAGPTPPLRLPEIQRATLSNGATLMLVEHHELPVVQMTLVIMAGSSNP